MAGCATVWKARRWATLLLILPGVLAMPSAAADVTPPSLQPVVDAGATVVDGAFVVAEAGVVYVFQLGEISEANLMKVVDGLPGAVVIPVSIIEDLLQATTGFAVVVVEFAGASFDAAQDASEAEVAEIIAFIDREAFVDADLSDGNTAACADTACTFLRFGEPVRVDLQNEGVPLATVDTQCGTGDTDCDGFTTLFEVLNGRDPLDPNG